MGILQVPYVLTLPLGASDLIPSLIEDAVAETIRFYPEKGADDTGGFLAEIMRMTEQMQAAEGEETKSRSEPPHPPTIEEMAAGTETLD